METIRDKEKIDNFIAKSTKVTSLTNHDFKDRTLERLSSLRSLKLLPMDLVRIETQKKFVKEMKAMDNGMDFRAPLLEILEQE